MSDQIVRKESPGTQEAMTEEVGVLLSLYDRLKIAGDKLQQKVDRARKSDEDIAGPDRRRV